MVRVPVRRCQREPFGILHHQQITSTFTFYLLKKGKQRLWRALSLRREEEGGGEARVASALRCDSGWECTYLRTRKRTSSGRRCSSPGGSRPCHWGDRKCVSNPRLERVGRLFVETREKREEEGQMCRVHAQLEFAEENETKRCWLLEIPKNKK